MLPLNNKLKGMDLTVLQDHEGARHRTASDRGHSWHHGDCKGEITNVTKWSETDSRV